MRRDALDFAKGYIIQGYIHSKGHGQYAQSCEVSPCIRVPHGPDATLGFPDNLVDDISAHDIGV